MTIKILAIITVAFNAIIFLLPVQRTAVFWTSYGFLMLAFLIQFVVAFLKWEKETSYRGRFLAVPLLRGGLYYLVLQTVSFGVFVWLISRDTPLYFSLITNVILLGGYLVYFVLIDTGKKEMARIDKKLQGKVSYIKALQAEVETVIQRMSDEEAKKKLKKLSEIIKYSDPMSNESLSLIEAKIANKAAELSDLADKQPDKLGELCEGIEQLLDERNRKCKLLKA